jgi:hypothetical protein
VLPGARHWPLAALDLAVEDGRHLLRAQPLSNREQIVVQVMAAINQ